MEKFEAREEEKAPIGHCHITSKEKTIPEPISKEYIREKNCNDCSLGCLFISEFFFGQYKETIDNDKSEFEDVFDIPTLDVYQIDVES